MGKAEDKKGDYVSLGEEQIKKENKKEAAAEGAEIAKVNAAKLVAKTQTAFETAIGAIEDLKLLNLATNYLTGVANISKQQLENYMKAFMDRNTIAENSHAFKLIQTTNACLFLDDKHSERVAYMTTFLITRETAIKVEMTINS